MIPSRRRFFFIIRIYRNPFTANQISLARPACPITVVSASLAALLSQWALMAHQRRVQGHLHVHVHAHAGPGRLHQHHPTVSCNECGVCVCVWAELMPPQLLKRSRRRTHNVAPAVWCRAAARRKQAAGCLRWWQAWCSLSQQQMDDGRGPQNTQSVALFDRNMGRLNLCCK